MCVCVCVCVCVCGLALSQAPGCVVDVCVFSRGGHVRLCEETSFAVPHCVVASFMVPHCVVEVATQYH